LQVHKDEEEAGLIKELTRRVGELSSNMERLRLAEYVEMLENPRRLLFTNFLLGLARGFGTAIGFTILAALVLYILKKIVILNMPVIGDFIADLVEIVQTQINVGGTIFYYFSERI
jgi:hypothetical protein